MTDEAPEILPVDNDGVVVVGIGTGIWLIALVIAIVFQDRLRQDGHLWWIACAATGFGLGIAGVGLCARRRNRITR